MKHITISAGGVSLTAELNDSPTAQQVWDALPIEGDANIWGDEIYFKIPVVAAQAPDARAEVDVGALGYWPVGHAFCIFFGETPMSQDGKIIPASAVNIIGKVKGDPAKLKGVMHLKDVLIERIDE